MVVALFMVLVLSVLGSALVFVSRTEALSSLNYKTMSQTRYGAESGIHRVANHLLWTYVPPTPAQLPLYNIDVMPVRVVANGRPVVLGLTAAASNYPDAVQVGNYGNIAQGKQLYQTCVACHGARGEGNATLRAPALAARSDWYLVTQLRNFKLKLRGADERDTLGAQMLAISATLPDDKAINDVVAYINTF